MTPKQLEAMVQTMRALGVIECDGIKLGPEPQTPSSAKPREPTDIAKARIERQHQIMFAATRARPPLPKPDVYANVPRHVVQRQQAQEHGRGETKPGDRKRA